MQTDFFELSRKHQTLCMKGGNESDSQSEKKDDLKRKVKDLEVELLTLKGRYDKLKESLKTLKKTYKKLKGKDGDEADEGNGLTRMKTFKAASPKHETVKR